jgi:hypothetical protein
VGQVLEIAKGYDRSWASTLLNGGVAVAYTSAAVFDASVWRGASGTILFVPTLAWVSAPAGTYTLTIASAQTSALDPGDYRIAAGVTAGGVHSAILSRDATLRIIDGPGTITLRIPYAALADLRLYYDQLDNLLNKLADSTNFLTVLANESDRIDRDLVNRYDPSPGMTRTRQNTADPIVGFDVPGGSPPSKAALTTALLASGLIPERALREIVARRSIAEVLDRQEVQGGRNPYREEAEAMRMKADDLWRHYHAEIDINADGVPDVLIHRDAILLPAGTKP